MQFPRQRMRSYPKRGALGQRVLCYSGPMPESEIALPTDWGRLGGSLVLPETPGPWPVALLVAGSGPTDRDGNNPLLSAPCDNLKLLARALAARGIASLRYDKRGIGASQYPGLGEEALRFEQLVDDAVALGLMLQEDERLGELLLVGHSEGALVAALAAQGVDARAVVCIAGAGERASTLMRKQVQAALPEGGLRDAATSALAALEAQQAVADVPDELVLLLRASVQPYLMSWFRHDPAEVLGRVPAPVLLVHGAADAQVEPRHAQLLQAGRSDARLRLLAGMDHLLALEGDVEAGTQAVAAEVAGWLRELNEGPAARP